MDASSCACEWDKDCDVEEYFKNSTCMKRFIDESVITGDEIINTPHIVSIDSIDRKATCTMGYYFLHAFY